MAFVTYILFMVLSARHGLCQTSSGDDENSGSDSGSGAVSETAATISSVASTTSTTTVHSGGGGSDESATAFFEQTWFIGACAGVGGLLLLTLLVIVIANVKRQKLLKQQKSHHKHDETRKQSVENNRRRSVLEELMGYDPMSPEDANDLSEADVSHWVASNDQLRLPHVAVDGAVSAPFSSHGVIRKTKSQVSMNARMFVKDWGEELPSVPAVDNHSNVVLNPLFEESTIANGELVSDDRPSLQRGPSQLSLMRKLLAETDTLNSSETAIAWATDSET